MKGRKERELALLYLYTLSQNQQCKLYLNVCQWQRVPRPKSDDDPVPVKGGTLRHLTTKEGKKTKHLIFDVAFNPYVLEECMKEKTLEDMLISLSLDFLEDITALRVQRKSCMKVKERVMGVAMDVHCSLDEQWRELLSQASRLDVGESLLSQLKELKVGDKKEGLLANGVSVSLHSRQGSCQNLPPLLANLYL